MLKEIVEAIRFQDKPLPVGHILHEGFIFQCEERHPIGKLVATIAVGNPYDDAEFQLDQSQQGFSADNPICKICGKGVAL